jgi:hypothetical protein
VGYHSTPTRRVDIKNIDSTKCWLGCSARGSIIYCCGNAKWENHFGRQLSDYLQNYMIQQLSCLAFTPKSCKLVSIQKPAHIYIQQLYSKLPKLGSNWDASKHLIWWMDKLWYNQKTNHYSVIKTKWAIKLWIKLTHMLNPVWKIHILYTLWLSRQWKTVQKLISLQGLKEDE